MMLFNYLLVFLLPLLVTAIPHSTPDDSNNTDTDIDTNANDILTTTSIFSSTISTLKGLDLTSCSLNTTTLNINYNLTALPTPATNLTLQHVALGRGTQNYTCSSPQNTTSKPTSVGALATLFDASCIASVDEELLHHLPALVQGIPLETLDFLATLISLACAGEGILGEHYFTGNGQPSFDLRFSGDDDWATMKKVASANAPKSVDVPWLKLVKIEGEGIKEVYRVYTAGGVSPATCEGQEGEFEVEYAAEYWFYG
ncbi:hypothetical protein CBS147343_8296 [Aspergillus niger]|uniref:DUF3455 domain-containing protein n=1 Tax=Aspergillus lacticoffeatus (strain CBS 101883) TaxID=1450533 RepID=UPI000D7F4F9C|nr:uncharacterized protein BO96DRAFT_496207 [Aspergillus niger CBS 101883]KAI2870639.1 hypothetical protein CBS11852_11086 [Aspergillus niger]KAI2945432.1 hypothetical protein CBS147322_7597 [Aspergillus niger]KAI2952913.1 hypothetical protein CBS147321_645 [Aspergillus niger]KAI3063562.1 hypothetical protein CBS147343_8296 [Aspergillus niger]PYH62967.1 hypothetical protein BO96DRAFT_496207 [Aspergillus niger CBS 101883]